MNTTGISRTQNSQCVIMYLSLGTMVMYFAALSSAYIVKRSQAQWLIIELPVQFFWASFFVLLSSVSMYLTVRFAKSQLLAKSQLALLLTLVLGLSFVSAQFAGFRFLMENGVHLDGNVAGAFIYLIVWSHLIHIFAGLISLLVIYILQRQRKHCLYNSLSIASIFWHFIDIIWLYLLLLIYVLR